VNITVQQYNAVIEGLRMQLSLQRGITREKIDIIQNLLSDNQRLRDGVEGMKSALQVEQDTSARLSQKLYACEVALANPGVDVTDEALRSPALVGIQELQAQLASRGLRRKAKK
jgi:hypothetical protein